MNNLTFTLLKEIVGVCRLEPNSKIPDWINNECFFSITKTYNELSIVCDENKIPLEVKCEREWRILKVEGQLDFSLIGILSKISTILANAGISIFAISTFDTDYILVKEKDLDKAVEALSKQSYVINI